MGKQRTSRPQAFKATAAASSEMKAHVGKVNPGTELQKDRAAEDRQDAAKLAELVDSFWEDNARVKTSRLIPISGYPNLKLKSLDPRG